MINVIINVKTGCNGDRQVMFPAQTVKETLRGKQKLARQRIAEVEELHEKEYQVGISWEKR